MENEQAFEAEVDVEAFEIVDSRSRQRSSHKGHDTLKAAFGSLGPEEDGNYEHTPLLPRENGQNQENPRAAEDGNGPGRGPPTWDGEMDFEGRPWWNKPSVWIPSLRSHIDINELTSTDILAPPSLRTLHNGLWRYHRPASQPHPLPCMPRILL